MTKYKHTRAFINKVFRAKLTPSNDSELLEEVMELMLAPCPKKVEKAKKPKMGDWFSKWVYTELRTEVGLDPKEAIAATKTVISILNSHD